jgi:hypothetical protein
MNQNHVEKEEWIVKIKIFKETTNDILNLQSEWKDSNNWDLKKLLIHLQAWDEEYLCVLEGLKQGYSYIPQYRRFPDYNEEDHMIFVNRWNDQVLREKSSLSLEEVQKIFVKTRENALKEFEHLWNDQTGLLFSIFALRIDDLSNHDRKHLQKGL